MNPYKLKEVYKYLTRAKKIQPDLPDVFPASKAPIPAKTQNVEEIEAINRFNRANPRTEKAGGGMLVQPSDDGSRPGYKDKKKGNPNFNTKEFFKKRDAGKDITKVKEYLNKILRKKDSITFDSIPDIKKKVGLAETSKIDADISRLLTNQYKDTVKTKGQLAKVGNAEKFRNILRDIQETIPKGKKQFINIAFTATKNKLSGSPNSGAYSRVLQEPEFNNFVVLTKDVQSNPQIIRFAEEFETLYADGELGKFTEEELAKNIYGDTKPNTISKIRADASKYAEFLYGVRDVTDADGRKLKMPNIEKRGDFLFELLDELDALEEGKKGKVKQIRYNSGVIRDRMFAIRDGLLGLKEGETDSQRLKIKKLLKKGYNLDEVAGLAATHEIAPGYTELVQGLKKKVNADKMLQIDKPFARIFEQVITGQKPIKGFQYGFDKSGKPKFYQDINEVVKLYNKDAAAYGKKYNIDTPLIEYDPRPGKKVNPKDFLPNFKYLSPAAQANVKELADQGIGVRTGAFTMNQLENLDLTSDKKTQAKILKKMGFECKFAGSNGGLSRCDDPASYTDDIKKTRSELNSSDVAVRAAANAKLNKGLQVAKKLPQIGKFLRRVGQATVGGVSKALQATGFGTPVGLAIEGMVEGGIYDYYRGQGYTHDQAYQEGFITPLITGRPDGVPWYGGAESMLEKELVGATGLDEEGKTIATPENISGKVAQYVSALKDQDQVYDAFGRLEQGQKSQRKDITDTAQADIQDAYRSGMVDRVNKLINADTKFDSESPFQAYEEAVQAQAAKQAARGKAYKDANYINQDTTQDFDNKLQKKRNEDMLQMFPPPTVETVQDAYKYYGIEDRLKSFTAQDYKDEMKRFDDFQKQSYFADNFRLEKAGGGIAKLAGVSSGTAPVRGPNPQGLLSLKNRVRNY